MNKIRKISALVSVLATLAFASSASAAVYTYDFGGPSISGNGITPSSNFATLSVDDITNIFTLTLVNLVSKGFIGTPSVSDLAISYLPDSLANTVNVVGGSVSGGVASVTTNNGNDPLGNFNFSFGFGTNSDKLISNEIVTWKADTNFVFTNLNNGQSGLFAIRVDGANQSGEGAAWYGVTAVPEPETYAMMLIGLGLMGFSVRRRKNEQA